MTGSNQRRVHDGRGRHAVVGQGLPRLAFWAAAGLIIIMIGAVYTHLTVPEAGPPTGAAVALVALLFIAWRRKSTALFLS